MACSSDFGRCSGGNVQSRLSTSERKRRSTALIFTLATFNVLGITSPVKRDELLRDCYYRKIDILAVQETKCRQFEDSVLHFTDDDGKSHKYRFINFQQFDNKWQAGIGFLVNSVYTNYIKCYNNISDRVAYLDLEIPSKSGKPRLCRVINAYGHTQVNCDKYPQRRDYFYKFLSKAVDIPSSWDLYILGDFNSRLGKLSHSDTVFGYNDFMGMYGSGKRNSNGEHLLNFLVDKKLFACNTSFQHPVRHITTRIGFMKDYSAPKNSHRTLPYYSQIDYVLCSSRLKKLLVNSRSYGGTLVKSDHKIVITRFNFSDAHLVFPKQKPKMHFDITTLVSNPAAKMHYNKTLNDILTDSPVNPNPEEELNSLFHNVHKAAEVSIGYLPRKRPKNFCNDLEIREMSDEKKVLQAQLNQNNTSEDRSVIRTKINRIQNDTRKRIKLLQEEHADTLVEEINETDSSRAYFAATRQLAGIKRAPTISVHDENSNFIGTDTGKAATLKNHFEEKFTAKHTVEPIDTFFDQPSPLADPITAIEVEMAAKALKNGRATGPDDIPSELIKYANRSVFQKYADCINTAFETNTTITSIGKGNITPLQKPKKPLGPAANIRPLTLSNCSRKLLSMITLKRIQGKLDQYTGPTQSAYKRGRSCGDIIWSQRMLTSVVLRKHWSYHRMSIDMSSAFDTISRETVLNVLEDAGCTSDEIRMVRLLLSNTVLKVKVNNTVSIEFQSTTGAFQGDALSGNLFTVVEAAALIHLRSVLSQVSSTPYPVNHPIPNPPISEEFMPLETGYSDDIDFNNTELAPLKEMLPIAKDIFQQWDLHINPSKTEFVHFYLADPKPTVKRKVIVGKVYRGDEEWRSNKTLGSLMCTVKDIKNRIFLGNVAFSKFQKVWMKSKISVQRKIKIYEAQVVSILLYNCNSWAAPLASLNELDIAHRKHLRRILNIRWPTGVISNEALYARCYVTPLSVRVSKFRWRMLGHILRGQEDSPAYTSMLFAINSDIFMEGRRGRPCLNLLDVIRKDLTSRNLDIRLKNLTDFEDLRFLALDREEWKKLEDG